MTREFGLTITAEQLLALAGKPSKAILELLCAEQGVTVDAEAAVLRKSDLYCQLATEVRRGGRGRGAGLGPLGVPLPVASLREEGGVVS